jgi:hypothetical protein
MQYNSVTTLNEIRAHAPCEDGWEKLLAHLGKTQSDDEPLPLLTILESTGFDHAVWCLRAASLDRLSRHFQAWCAEQVLHLFEAEHPNDARVRDQIAMLRNDDASPEERAATRAAAWDAWDSTTGEVLAAVDAGGAAAWDSAWFTAAAAVEAAVEAVVDGEGDDEMDAALDAQEQQLRKMISSI